MLQIVLSHPRYNMYSLAGKLKQITEQNTYLQLLFNN